jgi:hypothetical protein
LLFCIHNCCLHAALIFFCIIWYKGESSVAVVFQTCKYLNTCYSTHFIDIPKYLMWWRSPMSCIVFCCWTNIMRSSYLIARNLNSDCYYSLSLLHVSSVCCTEACSCVIVWFCYFLLDLVCFNVCYCYLLGLLTIGCVDHVVGQSMVQHSSFFITNCLDSYFGNCWCGRRIDNSWRLLEGFENRI